MNYQENTRLYENRNEKNAQTENLVSKMKILLECLARKITAAEDWISKLSWSEENFQTKAKDGKCLEKKQTKKTQ